MNERELNFRYYSKKLSDATDNIPLEHAIKSHHTGKARFRDAFVFIKMALTESLSYFAIILSLITFTALTPQAIDNINGFIRLTGLDFLIIPKNFASIAIFIVVAFIFAFGIVAYRFFGLAKSANEIANRYSPVNYLIFNEIQELKQEIKELRGAEKGK